MSVTYDGVTKGTELPARSYQVTRLDLVKYAGASGDFNVIHWSDRAARAVGLPSVIAHGMYTMAQAGKFVTEWAGGDPGAVTGFGVNFCRRDNARSWAVRFAPRSAAFRDAAASSRM